jgi:hypothetical protein
VSAWQREARIFEFCIRHARQIVAELESSSGEHDEDTTMLYELMEGWEVLQRCAEAEAARVRGDA